MVQKGKDLVAIVDREDNVLYVTERRIADNYGLRRRSARTIVFDSELKRTFVHRRAKKPVNGGLLDIGTAETPHVEWAQNTPFHVKEAYASEMMRGNPFVKLAYDALIRQGDPFINEFYSDAAARGFFEEGTDSKGSLENIVKDTKHISKLPLIDIPGSPRIYDVHGIVHYQASHGLLIPEAEEIVEWGWKTEPELQDMLNEGKELMGIAPIIGQLALYVMRNPSVIVDKIEINVKEVYAQ